MAIYWMKCGCCWATHTLGDGKKMRYLPGSYGGDGEFEIDDSIPSASPGRTMTDEEIRHKITDAIQQALREKRADTLKRLGNLLDIGGDWS